MRAGLLETYTPSGSFGLGGAMMAFGVAVPIAVVAGALYGALECVNPLIYFTIIGTFLLGIGLGVVDNRLLKMGQVRAPWLAALLALWTGGWALYGAWTGWATAFMYQVGQGMVVWDPFTLIALVMAVLEEGAWSLKEFTPTGGILAAIWGIEALIIVGATVVTGRSQASEPYCERTGMWFSDEFEGLVLEDLADEALFKLCGDGALTEVAGRPLTALDVVLVASLKVGQGPPETGALSFERVTVTVDGKGKKKTTRKDVLKHLLVRGTQLEAARGMPGARAQANSPVGGE